MSSTVNFKVYLVTEEDSDKQEIRRFGIDQDVVTNFLYLREKLVNVFPTLRGRHFTISWKDADEDNVVISSDEEWGIALGETANDLVRKLYVFVHSEYPKGYTNLPRGSSGIIHDGVVCDGCEKEVQGFRYKCLQCPDYDLCSGCDASGLHEDHCMIRLVVPAQWKPHWGRRIAALMNRSTRRACSAAEDEKETKCQFVNVKRVSTTKEERQDKYSQREKDYHRSKSGKDSKHGKQAKRHCNGTDSYSWANTFASYLNDWANLPGECPMMDKATQEAAAAVEKTATSAASAAAAAAAASSAAVAAASVAAEAAAAAVAADFAASAPAPEKNDEPTKKIPKSDSNTDKLKDQKINAEKKKNPIDPYVELLKMVGENFTPFIETFVNPQPTGGMSQIQKAAADAAAAAVASHFGAQTNGCPFKKNDNQPQEAEKPKESDSIPAKAPEKSTPMETEPIETIAADKSSDNDDWTIIGTNASSSSSDKAIPLPYKIPEESKSSLNGIYPKLPEVEKAPEAKETIIYHQDHKIQQAIETMMEMGFSNEGGWLTNLLVSKDGDIARALDTLSPIRR